MVGDDHSGGKVRHLPKWETESEIVDEVRIDLEEVVLAEEGFESVGIIRADDFGKDVRRIVGRFVKGRAVMNV